MSSVQYQMRVIALGEGGRHLDASEWTDSVIGGGRHTATYTPISLLKTVLPPPSESLQLFVHKHCIIKSLFEIKIL